MERRIFVFVSAGSRAVHPGAVSLSSTLVPPSVAKRRSLGVGDGGDVVERARVRCSIRRHCSVCHSSCLAICSSSFARNALVGKAGFALPVEDDADEGRRRGAAGALDERGDGAMAGFGGRGRARELASGEDQRFVSAELVGGDEARVAERVEREDFSSCGRDLVVEDALEDARRLGVVLGLGHIAAIAK